MAADPGTGAELPETDGPLIAVTLPDRQEVYAVLRRRRKAPEGWWMHVELPLHVRTVRGDGSAVVEPSPMRWWAPASACAPIQGQDYGRVPTERPGHRPAWLLEQHTPGSSPELVLHRGDCAAQDGGVTRPLDDAGLRRTLPQRPELAPCPVCRPDRALDQHAHAHADPDRHSGGETP